MARRLQSVIFCGVSAYSLFVISAIWRYVLNGLLKDTGWTCERYWIRPSKALLTVAWSHPYPEGTVSAMVSSVIERHDVTDGTCPAAEVPLRYGLTAIDENDTQRNRKKIPKVFSVRWKSCIFAYDRLRLTSLSIGYPRHSPSVSLRQKLGSALVGTILRQY